MECLKTFTQYPDFLVPYKRYILDFMLVLCGAYLEEETASYRNTTSPEDEPRGYLNINPDDSLSIDERQMSHTTLWNWVKWLGGLTKFADYGINLLRQKQPNFSLHRDGFIVAPTKYKSDERKTLLERCYMLLKIAEEFEREFHRNIFHRLSNSLLEKPG